MAHEELPELSSLILRPPTTKTRSLRLPSTTLRRSPRKQVTAAPKTHNESEEVSQVQISSQQRMSPRKQTSSKQPTGRAKARENVLVDGPVLAPAYRKASLRSKIQPLQVFDDGSDDDLADIMKPISSLSFQNTKEEVSSDKENLVSRLERQSKEPTSAMSRITQAAKQSTRKTSTTRTRKIPLPKTSNPYILKEAHCEDPNESSGSEDEEEDTDLSGFIVADDADLSFDGSENDLSSAGETEQRRTRTKQKTIAKGSKRLVRGRRKITSDSEGEDDQGLSKALDGMNLGDRTLEKEKNARRKQTLEIIDLTSSPIQPKQAVVDEESSDTEEEEPPRPNPLDLFSNLNPAIKLQPRSQIQPQLLPSKNGPLLASPKRSVKTENKLERPCTPPATPPRSPSKTKLKSPTKLLSPSKRVTEVQRSPHRQSMDGFWDHNVVNEWNDTYSPKKAPTLSPRKNLLARFNLYATDDFDDQSDLDSSQPTNSSQDPFDESSDSLPSPSESPSKLRSPTKISALKVEQARLREEKRAKLAAKKQFDSEKEAMALNLLFALDQFVTDSKIATMSASTGGIKVIWSKTLRSTAGRANWKRTVTKPSGSPVKGDLNSQSIERQPGVLVQHFASIELAEKIIDRPERLVNTLAHEFCHLANFMVSNVRDQPHGESFKRWGNKVTAWLRSSAANKADGWRAEWKLAEVTTKHSYVVETKYLWICAGRPAERQKQTFAMKMLNIENEDEDGCGAEYGRHSKSIDVEKQRCGRCKGFLVQVRPAPRANASPRKGSSPIKRSGLRTVREESSGVDMLEKMLEVVELSD